MDMAADGVSLPRDTKNPHYGHDSRLGPGHALHRLVKVVVYVNLLECQPVLLLVQLGGCWAGPLLGGLPHLWTLRERKCQ